MPNVLVLGSGAREHALIRRLAADGRDLRLHCAPGNPGIAETAMCHEIDMNDGPAVAALASSLQCALVVIGPEVPLTHGVADAVRAVGIPCFGPSRGAAQLEASKAFAKEVMAAARVPTAAAYVCADVASASAALDAVARDAVPFVVKDDSLAAGKGVVVTLDRGVALAHAEAVFEQGAASGAATGARVLIEEYLDGPEVSLFFLSDGVGVRPLLPATDFKRLLDSDAGPNTGGMGAYCPLPWAPPDLAEEVSRDIAQPVVDELRRRGTPFAGLLYAGLALTGEGVKVVEFNARFGDPETQAVTALLESSLYDALHAAATGTLADLPPLRWREGAAVCVVLAAAGYPDNPRKGDVIETGGRGPAGDAESADVSWVLHAGTSLDANGRLLTAGGRVLSVVALGADVAEARDRAYSLASDIGFEGAQMRSDIALAAASGSLPAYGRINP